MEKQTSHLQSLLFPSPPSCVSKTTCTSDDNFWLKTVTFGQPTLHNNSWSVHYGFHDSLLDKHTIQWRLHTFVTTSFIRDNSSLYQVFILTTLHFVNPSSLQKATQTNASATYIHRQMNELQQTPVPWFLDLPLVSLCFHLVFVNIWSISVIF